MVETAAVAGRDPPVTKRSIEDHLIELALADPDAAPDVIDALKMISFEPVTFFPLLTDVEWKAQVSASLGYDRQEKYTEYQRSFERDNEGVLRYKPIPYTATKFSTDWQPFSQVMTGIVVLDLPAVEVPGRLAHALNQFSRQGAYLASEIPQSANVIQPDPMDATLRRHGGVLSAAIIEQIEKGLPGDRKRDIRYSPTYAGQIRFLPIWQGTMSYAGSKLPITASALNREDLLFDAPKDSELISLRATRRVNAIVLLGFGLLVGAGVLIAAPSGKALISGSSFMSGAALALATVVSASLLFSWPLIDRPLTFKIRERLASNVRRLAIAAGITDDAALRLRETKNRKSDGERLIAHALAWLGSAGITLYGLYFVFLVLSANP